MVKTINLSDITFRKISREEVSPMLINNHYLHRMPPLSVAYGAIYNNNIIGVLTFGKPPSNSLCKGICGDEWSSSVYELNRLYTIDDSPKNLESKFISFALNDLKTKNWIIVSYADKGMGHSGYIYQATNWIYTGLSAKRTDVYVGEGLHSRTYTEEQRNFVIRSVRSMKHRYVYMCGDKRFKKNALNALKYPIIKEYPKEKPEHYKSGDAERKWLYNKNTKKLFTQEEFLRNTRKYLSEEEYDDYMRIYKQ